MTRTRILAGAVAFAIAMATMATAAEAKVYYETPFGQVVSKPKRIEFSDLTLYRIHWSHWGRKKSFGSGRARINLCDPSCSAENIVRGSAHLKMFKRHMEGSKRFYGCLIGTTKAEGRKEHVEWPPGCNR
jgi:hypothetical protein